MFSLVINDDTYFPTVQLGGAIALEAPSGVSELGFTVWLISVLYRSALLNLSLGASTYVLVLVSLQS